MKEKQIKEYETGDHCYGSILRVNGEDYNDMLDNDVNSSSLLRDLFEKALEFLQFDMEESNDDTCDQCGNWNSYYKYVRPE